MSSDPNLPLDVEWIRRAVAAMDTIKRHRLQDELGAELRATMPNCDDKWICFGDAAFYAAELARSIPREFAPREAVEAIAREHVSGTRRKAYLASLETVAALANQRPAPQAEPIEEPEECPPEPPGDWMPSYLAKAEQKPAETIEIKSAAEVPESVKRAQARRTGRK